ncbi:hypothetical protein CCACVL1_30329 [Corchorus capsularis]|uniref:Uncharacterized protein n=1 Tax=Corchorus capsularis TaxID=210143 RepID=A0A1R3FXT3_COCAP|nr:hypothetical protein CCACVL1_30329 [Corchorus capsularis]
MARRDGINNRGTRRFVGGEAEAEEATPLPSLVRGYEACALICSKISSFPITAKTQRFAN